MKMDLNRWEINWRFSTLNLKRPPEDSPGWNDTFMVFFSRVVKPGISLACATTCRTVKHYQLGFQLLRKGSSALGEVRWWSLMSKCWGCLVEQWKKGTWLFRVYIGDEIIPSYIGIKIIHTWTFQFGCDLWFFWNGVNWPSPIGFNNPAPLGRW